MRDSHAHSHSRGNSYGYTDSDTYADFNAYSDSCSDGYGYGNAYGWTGVTALGAVLPILVVINLVLGAILLAFGISEEMKHVPMQLLVAYIGFQAFAIVTCRALTQVMEARESQVVSALGFADPYRRRSR